MAFPEWRAFVSAADTGIWVEVIPSVNIRSCSLHVNNREEHSEVIQQFFYTVPDEILSITSAFPDSHWLLVKAAVLIGAEFVTLMNTNSCLAYLIVNIEKFNPSFSLYSNAALFQRLIKRKRKEIAGLCGYPESTQMVNILSRIKLEMIDLKTLLVLRDLFKSHSGFAEELLRQLSFSRTINRNLVLLMGNYPHLTAYLGEQALHQLIESPDFREIIIKLTRIHNYTEYLKITAVPVTAIEKIPEALKKLEEKVQLKSKFPDPPIEGNEFIIPVINEAQLKSWSKRHQNCVHSYGYRIRKRKCHIYKVILNNEEATLEVLIRGKQLLIGEITGRRNAPVSSALKAEIKRWFEKDRIKG